MHKRTQMQVPTGAAQLYVGLLSSAGSVYMFRGVTMRGRGPTIQKTLKHGQ
jgi:hypothetical protein